LQNLSLAKPQYNVSDTLKKKLLGYLPYAIGAILVVQFVALGLWQADRGMQKRAEKAAFDSHAGFASWSDGMDVRSFQKLKATGRFDAGHQFLLENIIINSRYGYYIITPLLVAEDEPVLLVNRGWLEKTSQDFDTSAITTAASRITVRGRAGSLPKAGYRMGEAIVPGSSWPMPAVYPTLDDLASALGRPVQPFVLLMDPQDEHGYYRHWVPEEMGPGRHFAYALQWFAMGVVLAALLAWNYRKRGLES
jgi:surfeit locus 1 family protein